MKKPIGLLFSLAFLHAPFSALANSVESVFQDAARFTVKIETTTLHPFLEDDGGIATGSGFLVDRQKGWVLTNRHVVAEGPSEVEVRFRETGYFTAEKVYLDPRLDLALVKIPVESIPDSAIEAPLGCYEASSIGNTVVIYGHPSGLDFTGTRGIVSGTIFTFGNEWIQTDAPLNAGNSGGPLISIKSGKVIGVNAAKVIGDDTEGLNFAVSIDHVCKIIELIEADMNPSPPALPIIFVAHDLDDEKLEVARSFLQDRSLLSAGDVITGVEGEDERVTNIDQLTYLLRGQQGEVALKVVRDDIERIVKFPVTPYPYLLEQQAMTFSGLTLKSHRLIDGNENGLDNPILVVGVIEGSGAYWQGFEPWESIYSVEGVDVSEMTLQELYEALSQFNNSGEQVTITTRYFSGSNATIFGYYNAHLVIEDLQLVSQ